MMTRKKSDRVRFFQGLQRTKKKARARRRHLLELETAQTPSDSQPVFLAEGILEPDSTLARNSDTNYWSTRRRDAAEENLRDYHDDRSDDSTGWRPPQLDAPGIFQSILKDKLRQEYPFTNNPSVLALQVNVLQAKIEWMRARLQIEKQKLQVVEEPAEAWTICLMMDNLNEECLESQKHMKEMGRVILEDQLIDESNASVHPPCNQKKNCETGLFSTVSFLLREFKLHTEYLKQSDNLGDIMTSIMSLRKAISSFRAFYQNFGSEALPPMTNLIVQEVEKNIEQVMDHIDARGIKAEGPDLQLIDELKEAVDKHNTNFNYE